MTDINSSSDGMGSLGSYGDKPDALIAAARPEFQYGLLQQILMPLVDAAVKITNDEQEQLRFIFRPLIKYGQTCIRRQRGWLTQIINQLLMTARTNVNQSGSSLQTAENVFRQNAGQTGPSSGEGEASGDEKTGDEALSSIPRSQLLPMQQAAGTLPAAAGAMPGVRPGPSQEGQGGGLGAGQGPGPVTPTTGREGAVQGQQPGAPPPVVINTATATGGIQQTVVNVNVPPCPARPEEKAGGTMPGGEGVGPLTEEPMEGPTFEDQKAPLVAAPAPDEGGAAEKGGAGDGKISNLFPFKIWDSGICLDVESYIKQFSALGLEILEWVSSIDQSLRDSLATVGSAVIDAALQRGIGEPVRISLTVLAAKDIIRLANRVLGSPYTKGNETLVGLWAVKSLLQAVESATVGADFKTLSITGRAEFHFEYPQLREIIDYLIDYVAPIKIPSVGDIANLLLTDGITSDHADCLVRLQGHDTTLFNRGVRGRRGRLDEFGLAREAFRFYRPLERIHDEFRGRGWLSIDDTERFIRAQEFIPPPTDAIMWTVREVFSTVDIGNKEVVEEYRGQVGLSEVLRLSGVVPITFRPENPGPVAALIKQHQSAVPWLKATDDGQITMDVPMMYWAAHYDHASPMQAYEMLHRLRPNRVKRYPLKDEKGNVQFPEPFDIEGVRSLLRLKDYHPIWRDRLAAISYRPLGRIDTRRIYNAGGFGDVKGVAGFDRLPDDSVVPTGEAEKEIVEQYKDQGYADIDAIRLGMFTAQEYDKSDATGRRKKALTLACKSFKAGIIDRDRFFVLVERAGVDRATAAVVVDNCEAELEYEQAIEGIKAVKTMFLRGIVDMSTANGFLANLGVVPERRNRYLTLWTINLKGREKAIPASEMCQWYQDGLISLVEMQERLLRLGYAPADAARVIRHCQIGQAAKGSKALEARAKAEAKEQKAKLAHRSDKFMIAAFKAKQLNALGIFNTLVSQGWPARDAQTWVRVNLKVNVDGTEFKADAEEGSEETEEPAA